MPLPSPKTGTTHMPIVNRVAAMLEEITAWRRDLHAHPELGFDVHRTAGIVVDKLKAFGCDNIVSGVGTTGVVGVIKGRKTASGKAVGLRADMDALPIQEMIAGKGSHAGRPHEGVGPVAVAAQTNMARQTVASRNVNQLDAVVVSTCIVRAGEAFNIIPQGTALIGAVRTLSEKVRSQTHDRMRQIAEGTAALFGATAKATFEGDVPVTVNDAEKTKFATGVAAQVVGGGNVKQMRPIMGAEGFSDMVKKRPGALFIL